MTARDTIQSNATDLLKAYHGVEGPRAIPQDATWYREEPNEYGDFGQTTNKVSRQPINAGRMKKKPTVVGFDASAGFIKDVTSENVKLDMQDFLFANMRSKGRLTSSDIAADGFVVDAGGEAFDIGDIIFVEGTSVNPSNLGLKVLVANGTNTKVLAAGLSADAAAEVTITRVGHQFAAGDLSVDIVDGYAHLISDDLTFTNWGLLPGEIYYLGGDTTATQFAETENRGWVRFYGLNPAGDALIIDKTDVEFVDDSGAGKTIQLFWGEVVKNEKSQGLQKTRYCAFRRLLGIPDPDTALVQSEVIVGCIANEATFTIPEEDKVTVEVGYLGRRSRKFKNDALVDPGETIVDVLEEDAINSTSDSRRLRMAVYPNKDDFSTAPVPVLPAFTEFELTINNNVSTNKAITYVGAYAHTPGFFDIMMTANGYFIDIGTLDAIDSNADFTMHYCTAKDNKGMAWDVPLIGLSTEGPAIEINEPIMLEVEAEAADGSKYNKLMNHAILMCFYAYLPTVAHESN